MAAQLNPGPAPRILVVDDEPAIRELNAGLLMGAGYKVDTADNGAVAWTALQLLEYDLLITDNLMPLLSGVDLILKLRTAGMTLPVILVSGEMPPASIQQDARMKIQATLCKPYSIVELLATVEQILRLGSEARSAAAPVPVSQTLAAGTRLQR